MVKVLGLSGLRKAYRSVLSAVGSSEIRGASRWLDAVLEPGARRATKSAVSAAPTAASRMNAQRLRIRCGSFLTAGRLGDQLVVAVVRGLIRPKSRSGSICVRHCCRCRFRRGTECLTLRVPIPLALLLRGAPDEVAEDREPEEDAARLRDQAGDAAVSEDQAHPWLSTQSPPTVNRTISTSIGYWVQSAIRGVLNSPTARSCATARPATCPTISAATCTYQIVCGVRNVKFGWKSWVPKMSQPRPHGSDSSRTPTSPW